MTSNLFSHFHPTHDPTSASIYETIHEHDQEATDLDEERLDALPRYSDSPQPSSRARALVPQPRSGQRRGNNSTLRSEITSRNAGPRPKATRSAGAADPEDFEDDVPASLLIEEFAQPQNGSATNLTGRDKRLPLPPSQMDPEWSPSPRTRYRSSELELPLHEPREPVIGNATLATASPTQRALWRWANVENLDNFLADVYDYYILKGYWSILLKRFLNLLTVAFVVGFCLFLTQCIDYGNLRGSTKLPDILVSRCTARMGFVPNVILWLTTLVSILRCFQYAVDIRRLNHLHDFYLYLLDVPESEIQSISWQEIVGRLMALRDSNPNIRSTQTNAKTRFRGTQSKQRMDAHDIANRLMRKDNYMIALINKEVLDTSLTLPILGKRQFFTRTLEWHLNYCIMDYVFNSQGQLRQLFLKDTHRKALSEGLRRRFVFAGTTSLIFAPFLIIYFLVQNFFQHFNEYQKDPAQIGSRQYNTYAQWKFREFNELWHLFGRRLKMSHPFATRYINQFPKDKTVQAARFVTFISGALVSILGLATVLDQENFLGFEITSGRTTIFYLGIFGSIWAVARGMLPDDNMIYDSSYSMEEVIEFTHFKPPHWDGRLHTVEVKTEFSQLYQMQIIVLFEEILSMIFTPFVLWFALPRCSDSIIDFFREFTVHVDGLGYVCSFAEFNFKKAGQVGTGGNAGTRVSQPANIAAQARDEYFAARDDKLERSYWGFINDYARNPKTDVRFPYAPHNRGAPFNNPPPFPGLLSPTMQHQPQAGDQEAEITGQALSPKILRATSKALEDSLPQSLLLDPHHQPGLKSQILTSPRSIRPRRAMGKSRLLPGMTDTMISTAVKEEDEDTPGVGTSRPDPPTEVAANAGDLGSWKYDDDDSDEGSDQAEDPDAIVHGGGVLGLVKQFQRAHDDDKRGGAGV